MKVATFTVHGSAEQAARWQRAAAAESHRSVGTWLALAADAYLRVRAKAGIPLPLAWSYGRFTVQLMDGREIETRGMVSPPLAYFRGTAYGPDLDKNRTLVHLPSGRIIATLRRSAQARALASELAPVFLRGELPELGPIVERHVRESV